MIILSCILIILGACITFFSKKISQVILSKKREPNEADIVYTKLVGFALILAATLIVFV